MEPILCWVVALRPEATPLISQMGLKAFKGTGDLFPLYRSRDGRTCLTISGIGRVNAGAATAYLAGSLPDRAMTAWINFGIAGSGNASYGQTFFASRIVEQGSQRSWYPGTVLDLPAGVSRAEVTTVDQATESYPVRGLVEMEASGFYQTALRVSTIEFCQVVKVVSDDPEHPVQGIDKRMVSDLCGASFPGLESWLAGLRTLLKEEVERRADPPGFSDWVETVRFSETERFQLRRLLLQWEALKYGPALLPASFPSGLSGAKSVLSAIRMKVAEASSRIL